MSKLKIINPVNLLFGGALLVITATHSLKPPQVSASSTAELKRQLEPAQIARSQGNLFLADDNLSSVWITISTISETDLLAQAAQTDIDEDKNKSDRRTELIRRLVFYCFLLFFVPLGIFYPLFLFYKMLLIKPEDKDDILASGHKLNIEELTDSTTNLPNKKDLTKATVSKLQIAFTPPAQELRKELSRVGSSADVHLKDNPIELIYQTVGVLIEQGHWTHASHSSLTLPLNLVRPEFDSISERERHKFMTKHSDSSDRNLNSSSYERNYSYVVVTLILCTTHDSPLFQTINTKEQLVRELERLRKIKEDSIIQFELLWNPQQEKTYLSNDRLLVEYGEMTRLF